MTSDRLRPIAERRSLSHFSDGPDPAGQLVIGASAMSLLTRVVFVVSLSFLAGADLAAQSDAAWKQTKYRTHYQRSTQAQREYLEKLLPPPGDVKKKKRAKRESKRAWRTFRQGYRQWLRSLDTIEKVLWANGIETTDKAQAYKAVLALSAEDRSRLNNTLRERHLLGKMQQDLQTWQTGSRFDDLMRHEKYADVVAMLERSAASGRDALRLAEARYRLWGVAGDPEQYVSAVRGILAEIWRVEDLRRSPRRPGAQPADGAQSLWTTEFGRRGGPWKIAELAPMIDQCLVLRSNERSNDRGLWQRVYERIALESEKAGTLQVAAVAAGRMKRYGDDYRQGAWLELRLEVKAGRLAGTRYLKRLHELWNGEKGTTTGSERKVDIAHRLGWADLSYLARHQVERNDVLGAANQAKQYGPTGHRQLLKECFTHLLNITEHRAQGVMGLAFAFLLQGEPQKAKDLVADHFAAIRDDPHAWMIVDLIELGNNGNDQFDTIRDRLLTTSGGKHVTLTRHATLLEAFGHDRRALRFRFAAATPETPDALVAAALAAERLGLWSESARGYREALAAGWRWEHARLLLVRALRHAGDLEAARRACAEALKADHGDPFVNWRAARLTFTSADGSDVSEFVRLSTDRGSPLAARIELGCAEALAGMASAAPRIVEATRLAKDERDRDGVRLALSECCDLLGEKALPLIRDVTQAEDGPANIAEWVGGRVWWNHLRGRDRIPLALPEGEKRLGCDFAYLRLIADMRSGLARSLAMPTNSLDDVIDELHRASMRPRRATENGAKR